MNFPSYLRAAATVALLFGSTGAEAQVQLVPRASTWRYLDNGTDPGPNWFSAGFNDSAWASGSGRFGYGVNENTTISFGPNPVQRHITSYFRTTFQVPDPTIFTGLELRLLRDDGAAVYLNGQEIQRDNLPATPLDSTVRAPGSISGYKQDFYYPKFLRPRDLVTGTNTIAVELHQDTPSSPDAAFDLGLVGHTGPSVIRGPYLQNMRPDAVVIRWRTLTPTAGAVWMGPSPQALTQSAAESTPRLEHEIEIRGLSDSSTIYYGIGEAGAPAPTIGADTLHRFHTPPPAGSRRPFRAWIIGDSGSLSYGQNRVRDAFLLKESEREADLMLLLGDNAYRQGLDLEYQTAFFEAYPSILRRIPAWSTRGNHEREEDNYYDTFTMPIGGEAGGIPSRSEAYYSFDWANVHFVCLDSFGSDRSVEGAMWRWVNLDLASTTQDWIIAFWHHSPYSKGSRNSDAEIPMAEMRQNFLPLLEDFGVSLVLGGHSHSYERSGLIQGHYAKSETFDPVTHGVDLGDGQPEGDGAYTIASPTPSAGSVYVVAGSSGQTSNGGDLDHPAMLVSQRKLGSLILDAAGSRLEVTFLDDSGNELDSFTFIDPTAETTFCDAPTDGQGCVATLRAEGQPSVSSGMPFRIIADDLRTQSLGILLYSLTARSRPGPFLGRLCLGSGTRRTSPQNSGGSGGSVPCTGRFDLDFAPLWGTGAPMGLNPGTTVYCQYWHRDTVAPGSTITEGLSFTVVP